MTQDMWITVAILMAAIVLFITEWLRVDIVALGVVLALSLTGILTTQEAIAGFSDTTVILIAALLVVGAGVFQTGLAGMIGSRILMIAGSDERRLMVVVMLAVAVLSGLMSNTGVVAMMMPAIISLAVTTKTPASRLLIPLAFASSLGGATTLIGTPPNIIVSEALRSATGTGFEFFSFLPLALLLIVAGVLFMLVIGRRLLPSRIQTSDIQPVETPAELFSMYKLPDNLFRLRVRSRSPLIGQPLSASNLGRDYNLNVLEIARPPQAREVVRLGEQRIMMQAADDAFIHPGPDFVLQRDDILIVQGLGNDVARASAYWNLAIQPASPKDQEALISSEVGLAEVVLPPRSALIGKNLVDVRFGTVYHLTVLDLRRPEVDERLDLKTTSLRFGDTLLVQGEWKDILSLKKKRRDFIVMGETHGLNGVLNRRKAPVAALILLGMLVLMVSGAVSTLLAAIIAGLAMVLTGCLSMDEAYEGIDWKSVVLIAGMLPMATALQNVGLVSLVAAAFESALGSLGPQIVMMGFFMLTALFTQVLSNTATAVLIAPIALVTAQNLGVRPEAFLMAVAVAASMAFASPVASPVNTLVMGPGSYRFSDYIKIGVPLIALTALVTAVALPLIWPF